MDLITQVRTANSLINFVTGGQMNVALTLIGDNHFRTYAYLKEEKLALLAIEQAEDAQTDKNELRGYSINPLEVWLLHYTFTISHITDLPALIQLRKVPEVSLPDYKNNLLRILPELCSY